MRERLRHFVDFDALAPARLDAVAARARRLRMPARRWLVRPGRTLAGRFYLLEGRVQLIEPDRSVIVGAGSARARRAIYPGPAGALTLTDALFLNIDPALLEPAGEGGDERVPAVPELLAEESSWQQRFLTSPLMERLDPPSWQRVLRAMVRLELEAGDVVIRAGDRADCCYVLCSGTAAITGPGGEPLAVLGAGSLFGEDALVSGRLRNANVVMSAPGQAARLPANVFRRWLLDVVVRPVAATAGRQPLRIAPAGGAGNGVPMHALRRAAGALAPRQAYVITGASYAERALAAFLLAEQGLDARPLRPEPCDRAPRS